MGLGSYEGARRDFMMSLLFAGHGGGRAHLLSALNPSMNGRRTVRDTKSG